MTDDSIEERLLRRHRAPRKVLGVGGEPRRPHPEEEDDDDGA